MKNAKIDKLPYIMIGTGLVLVVGLAAMYMGSGKLPTQQAFNFISPEETKTLPQDQPISQNEFNRINTVQAALVDGFPFKIDVYPEAKLVNSKEKVYEGRTSYTANYAARGTVIEIISFFKTQGEQNGWQAVNSPDLSRMSMEKQISFTKDNYKINIVAELENSPDDTQYTIDVIPL